MIEVIALALAAAAIIVGGVGLVGACWAVRRDQELIEEARTEYVTRDELTEKLDEVYQAIRDAYAYGPEYGAAPERTMPERPPIPPEPTGLGAAVRDVDGDYWVHVGEGSWQFGAPGGTEQPWDGVTRYGPLTVVFEGVES